MFWGWGLAIDLAIMIARYGKIIPYFNWMHSIIILLLNAGTLVIEIMTLYHNRS